MAEYLERESILNAIRKTSNLYVDQQGLYLSCELITAMPAADVQPVKHGRWIYVGSVRSWDEIKCSACNSAFSTEDRDLILNWDFCPHCGARMDGANQ